jgi:hypothetical protein
LVRTFALDRVGLAEPGGAHPFPEQEEAGQHGADGADAGPDGVGGAERQHLERLGEQGEEGEQRDGRDGRPAEARMAVGVLRRGGPDHVGENGQAEEGTGD